MTVVKKNMNVALLAFIDSENKILLNRRRTNTNSEMWEFIGGGIENGESALDAIKREITEEIGYKLSIQDELRFVHIFNYENDKITATVHFFTAKFPGLHHFSDSEETYVSDLALFEIREARALVLLPMTRAILEKGLLSTDSLLIW